MTRTLRHLLNKKQIYIVNPLENKNRIVWKIIYRGANYQLPNWKTQKKTDKVWLIQKPLWKIKLINHPLSLAIYHYNKSRFIWLIDYEFKTNLLRNTSVSGVTALNSRGGWNWMASEASRKIFDFTP